MLTRADRLLRCVRRIAAQAGPEPNDAALLASFLTGRDPSAFEALVARHGPMVLRVCRHLLGNRHDAEDAFQATFLVLARKAGSVRPTGSLAAWLHGVACRVALGARASTRRQRREPLAPDLAPPDPRPDPLAELTAREALSILEEEVQRLPEPYRLPVVLCCLHGLTQEDAARQLGWTPGSVKGRLERGRKHLQRRLAGRGLGLAAALALVEVSRATAASVGNRLVGSTATAATGVAFGNAVGTGLVSARVQRLAEGALTAGLLARLKVGFLLLLAAGVVATGLAALGHQPPAGDPVEKKEAEEPRRPAPEAEPPKSPKDKEQARTDRSGDPLPSGAVARLGSSRLNQGAAVMGLAFSPDGKVIASCGESSGEDYTIRLWDVATGKEVMSLRPNEHACTLNFSPDGRLLASAGPEASVRLWDVAGGKERCRCDDDSRWVTDLAFSPDGKLLAGNTGKGVTLWDTTTGKKVRTCEGDGKELWSVAFSPDGATLAAAGPENALHLWDVADGRGRRRIEVDPFKRPVRPLAFSPDGKMVALANDAPGIRLWDVATGRELRSLRGHTAHILRLTFSDGGKTLISASEDRTVRFWDTATGKEVRAVTTSAEVWDCWVMAFSPDRKTLAAGGSSGTVRLFDTATGKPRHARDGLTGPVEAVGFLPQGDLVASVGWRRDVRLAETATGKERHRSDSRPGYRLSMVLSQQFGDRLLLSPATLSRDGSLVAVPDRARENGAATVRVWEVASDREVGSLTGDIGSVLRLAFSPDKKTLALACFDKTVRVWDTAARKEVRRLTGHQGDIFGLAFSPDGKLLASASTDRTVRVWEPATGKEVYRLQHKAPVRAVAFSPDGRVLAAAGGQHLGTNAGDTDVYLWELATGLVRGRLRGDHHLVTCLAFAPDGKALALGSSDATVRVWDPLRNKELRRFDGHRGLVNSVAFSQDGKRLVSGSTDTTVLIWDTAGLASRAAPAATLTTAEREALWRDLTDADAGRAYRAVRALRADGKESGRFLKERLRPVAPTDSRQVARWVADLDADAFEVRENATAALAELGELAEPALRRALADRPPAELRRRAESLLGALAAGPSPEQLRALRAVEVLELLGTPEARELLATLGRGAPDARLTREAAAALRRLNGRP